MTSPAASEVLRIEALHVAFPSGKDRVHALRGVDLSIRRGETLAIVGESGSGKTTLARAALRLFDVGAEPEVRGTVRLAGEDVSAFDGRALRQLRRRVQLVFQDPYASLDPRMRVGQIVAEPLAIHAIGDRGERRARVRELLDQVGLPAGIEHRFPAALSGGQRQRVGLARTLAVDPELLVLDEPLSALDVSVQAQIVNLLVDLREGRQLTYLLIAHDLRLVRYLADRVAVMYLGRIVEEGPTSEVLGESRHPYTRLLVASSLGADLAEPASDSTDAVELPSPMFPPPGCAFAQRCPLAMERCRREMPELCPKGRVSTVACFAVEG